MQKKSRFFGGLFSAEIFPLVQLENIDYKGKTCKMCVFDRHFAYDRRIRILD